ncbi:retinol dehydrogenase 12, like-protein, partial [Chytriomyces sp. MP71]
QTVLVTGGSAGIGRINVRQFAALGAKVYVLGRNRGKTERVIDSIKKETGSQSIFFIPFDGNDLKSVADAANMFLKKESILNILVCNAGAATPAQPSNKDGFETLWCTNYLSHFLLTHLLLDTLKRTAKLQGNTPGCVRIINVSSMASEALAPLDWSTIHNPSNPALLNVPQFTAYARSKLAQVLSTIHLARLLNGTNIAVHSLHPGAVTTDIWTPTLEKGARADAGWLDRVSAVGVAAWKSTFMITEEQGSLTTLYCATAKEAGVQSGAFFDDCRARRNLNGAVSNDALIEALFEKSMEWVKPYFS